MADMASAANRASPPRYKLELDAKHELQLPGQAGARVWRSLVVVVVIEVYCRVDDPELTRVL
jgi:hypothetical protein